MHGAVSYNSIFVADQDILVSQHLYGLSPDESPVLHLRGGETGDLTGSYRDSFEGIWASARVFTIR